MTENNEVSCPECGSKNVVPILYGLPDEEAIKQVDQGKVVLGGCSLFESMPTIHCKKCRHEWNDEASENISDFEEMVKELERESNE